MGANTPRPPRSVRLDQALVAAGLFPSREKAQAAILAGEIFLGERALTKPGARVAPDAPLARRQKNPGHDFVGRGALKLLAALEAFSISPAGKICLDTGASTGGFTEVLLRGGAARVFAVDVGYGQLAWSLRNDPRVAVMERVNARHLTRALIPDPVALVTLDLSFISLRLVLPAVLGVAAPGADVVALVKPQFEAGKGEVPRGGVIRDPAQRAAILDGFRAFCQASPGVLWQGHIESPVTGADGNVEFLAWLKKQ